MSVVCGAYVVGDRSAFQGWREFRRTRSNSPCGRRWRQDLALLFVLLLPLLILKLADFRLDLRLELVRGTLELIQGFPDLAGNHRQLLGPKQKQRQDKQNHRVGKTHSLIIAKVLVSGNAEGFWVNSLTNASSIRRISKIERPERLLGSPSVVGAQI